MNGVGHEIHTMMMQLLSDMGSDFCALGLLEKDNRLRWKWAAGNISERFMDMEDKPGRGFQQSVIKVGRAMTIHVTDLIASRTLHEYPLLPSEKLRSVYAVPLYEEMNVIGLLVVGDRSKRIYKPEDRNRAAQAAEMMIVKLREISGIIHARHENMLN
jgi:nitrogen regulatory protein A